MVHVILLSREYATFVTGNIIKTSNRLRCLRPVSQTSCSSQIFTGAPDSGFTKRARRLVRVACYSWYVKYYCDYLHTFVFFCKRIVYVWVVFFARHKLEGHGQRGAQTETRLSEGPAARALQRQTWYREAFPRVCAKNEQEEGRARPRGTVCSDRARQVWKARGRPYGCTRKAPQLRTNLHLCCKALRWVCYSSFSL